MSLVEDVKKLVEELEGIKKQYESLNVEKLNEAIEILSGLIKGWTTIRDCLQHTCNVALSFREAELVLPDVLRGSCPCVVYYDNGEGVTIKQVLGMLRERVSKVFVCYLANTANSLARVAEIIAEAVPSTTAIKTKIEYVEDKVRELAGDDC